MHTTYCPLPLQRLRDSSITIADSKLDCRLTAQKALIGNDRTDMTESLEMHAARGYPVSVATSFSHLREWLFERFPPVQSRASDTRSHQMNVGGKCRYGGISSTLILRRHRLPRLRTNLLSHLVRLWRLYSIPGPILLPPLEGIGIVLGLVADFYFHFLLTHSESRRQPFPLIHYRHICFHE